MTYCKGKGSVEPMSVGLEMTIALPLGGGGSVGVGYGGGL